MEMTNQTDENKPEVEKVPPRKGSHPLLIGLMLFLLAGGLFGYFNASHEGEELEKTAKEYFEAVKSGNLTSAYYTYTSSGFQKGTSLKKFVSAVKGNILFEKMGSMHIQNHELKENSGQLLGFIKTTDGFQAPFNLWFVKEENDWKIDRFEAGPSVNALEKQKILEEVRAPILSQLTAIRQGSLEKAYFEETADEFKTATPIDHFKRFINSFPEIKDSRYEEFVDLSSANGQATVELALHTPSKSMKLVYEMIQDKGRWKIFSMQVVPFEQQSDVSEEDLTHIEKAVRNELDLISSGKLDEAYALTSKAFKAGTTKVEFDSFIKENPFLEKTSELKIKKWIDRNVGKALVEIPEENEVNIVDFTLFKEEGEWKIWGIEIKQGEASGFPSKGEDERFVSNLLSALREGKLQEAYDLFMADDFKKITSLQEFKQFVKSSPFLQASQKVRLYDRAVLNNKSIVKMEFIQNSGDNSEVVEFDLIKEGNKWKVIGIKILDLSPDDTMEELNRQEGLDASLEILSPARIVHGSYQIKKSASNLQAILTIEKAWEGEKMDVRLTHLESGQVLLEKIIPMEKSGTVSLPLFIKAPEGGFATGKYELLLSGRGDKHSFLFESIP